MKFKFLFLIPVLCFASSAHADWAYDTEDPLYLTPSNNFVSTTNGALGDSIFRLSQKFSYGINDVLSLGADLKYKQDFNGEEDGFSNLGLNAIIRTSRDSSMISDVLFGIDFSKNSDVAEFTHTIYTAGFRAGYRWSRFTLSGTVKTSWIFNETDGYAYIDLMPEAYVRINEMWATGLGFDMRKATESGLDRKFVNFKLVQTYGRTQYTEFISYEFETEDYTFGGRVAVVF